MWDPLAQLVEHNTFNVGVLGSSPKRITKEERQKRSFFVLYNYSLYIIILEGNSEQSILLGKHFYSFIKMRL